MIGLLDLIGFALGGAIMITMAFGIVLSAFMPTLDRWSKRYFIALFSLMLMCSVSCFLALVFWYDPSMAQASRIVYFLENVFLITPIFMPTLFILHYSGKKNKKQPSVLACDCRSRCVLRYQCRRSVYGRFLLRHTRQ